jgi:hypothetical protein
LRDFLMNFLLYTTKPVHSILDLIVLIIYGDIMNYEKPCVHPIVAVWIVLSLQYWLTCIKHEVICYVPRNLINSSAISSFSFPRLVHCVHFPDSCNLYSSVLLSSQETAFDTDTKQLSVGLSTVETNMDHLSKFLHLPYESLDSHICVLLVYVIIKVLFKNPMGAPCYKLLLKFHIIPF